MCGFSPVDFIPWQQLITDSSEPELTTIFSPRNSPLSYPAVNRYSSSSLSSQASAEVSNITGQSESSDEVFNMQVLYQLFVAHVPSLSVSIATVSVRAAGPMNGPSGKNLSSGQTCNHFALPGFPPSCRPCKETGPGGGEAGRLHRRSSEGHLGWLPCPGLSGGIHTHIAAAQHFLHRLLKKT